MIMDMTISKGQRDLLIGLLGVLIAVGVWFLVANPYREKTETLKAENEQLKPKWEEYQAVAANVEEYKTRIIDADANKEEIIAHFPSMLEREDQIMYWANAASKMSEEEEMDFSNLGMGPWTMVEVEGLNTEEQPQVDVEYDEEGNPIVSDDTGAAQTSSSNYELYTDTLQMDFQCTYNGLKDFTQYVLAQNDRNRIDRLEAYYDPATENLMGNMSLALYYLTGTGKEYVESPIPSVVSGSYDPFRTGFAPLNLEGEFDEEEAEAEGEAEENAD